MYRPTNQVADKVYLCMVECVSQGLISDSDAAKVFRQAMGMQPDIESATRPGYFCEATQQTIYDES